MVRESSQNHPSRPQGQQKVQWLTTGPLQCLLARRPEQSRNDHELADRKGGPYLDHGHTLEMTHGNKKRRKSKATGQAKLSHY
jgi:hypothetical protein